MTTVGFISCGRIGGYDVVLSNSRGPQTLKDLVEELGARVGGHAGRQGAAAQADAYAEPTREAHQ
jgi:8-hydroxy-5-deazaflavin:NADPH oxidoreductase